MNRSGRLDGSPLKVSLWVWCALGLAFWQVFLWAQNPSLMSDDSGEMIAASYRLGLAHPPAYPLFCLLGRLFSFAPVGTVAFRFNLLSSVFVLLSFYFLGLSCLAFTPWKKTKPSWLLTSACFLSLLFLFSCRSLFAQALTAKGCVYTLTLLFSSVFLWLRVRSYEKCLAQKQVFLILFLGSLGLANHWETEMLWIPFIVFWFYQEKVRWDMKGLLQAFSLILTGLSLYLYLPLRSALGALPSWGDPQTFRNFIWVVARESFRGSEALLQRPAVYTSFLKEYFRILTVYWIPGFAVAALIGLFYLWKQARPLFYSILLFYFPVVVGILLVTQEETKFLMTVFLVSTQGLVFFCGFVGTFLLLQKLLEINFKLSILAVVFLFGAGLFWTFKVFKQENKSQYYLASDFSINALKLLPSKSIFLAEGDNYVMPLFYQRFVLGLRPDVVFIPSIFLAHDWGWKQLAIQNPLAASAIKSSKTLSGGIEALGMLKGSGGLFNTLDQSYLAPVAMNNGWIPWALERLGAKTELNPQWVSSHVLKLALTERLRGLDEDYGPDDVTTFEIHHYYANQFFSTALWLHAKGDRDDALRCFELGLPFYPKAAYAYTYMASILGSEGYLGLAERLCLLGIAADSAYFGSYENLANVYRLQGDLLRAKESYQDGLNHVSDPTLHQVAMTTLGKMYESKPKVIVRDKKTWEYQALADRFQNEGLVFLAGLARQAGQAGR